MNLILKIKNLQKWNIKDLINLLTCCIEEYSNKIKTISDISCLVFRESRVK